MLAVALPVRSPSHWRETASWTARVDPFWRHPLHPQRWGRSGWPAHGGGAGDSLLAVRVCVLGPLCSPLTKMEDDHGRGNNTRQRSDKYRRDNRAAFRWAEPRRRPPELHADKATVLKAQARAVAVAERRTPRPVVSVRQAGHQPRLD